MVTQVKRPALRSDAVNGTFASHAAMTRPGPRDPQTLQGHPQPGERQPGALQGSQSVRPASVGRGPKTPPRAPGVDRPRCGAVLRAGDRDPGPHAGLHR